MAEQKPIIDPRTGRAFGPTEDPFNAAVAPIEQTARRLQEDFAATMARNPEQEGTVVDKPEVSETVKNVIQSEQDDISQTTSQMRDDKQQTQQSAQDILDQVTKDAQQRIAPLNERLESFEELIQESKQLTGADLQQIEQAGQAAGQAFDPLIARAEESKRQGLAKSVVGAGQRGGFLNTQFAGQAALTPTEGGTFVGAGGELSKIKGQLELNILKLQIAKQQAIAEAEASARKAIQTGKQQDIDNAELLMNKAKDLFEAENNAIQKRIQTISSLENIISTRGERQLAQDEFDREGREARVEALSLTLIGVDEDGNVITPTDEQIRSIATLEDVDPVALGAAVNQEIRELTEETLERRQDLLDAKKTEADIKATEALQRQRDASAQASRALAAKRSRVSQTDSDAQSSGFADKKTEETVRKFADSMIEDQFGGALISEEDYIAAASRMRRRFSEDDVSQEAILNLLGVTSVGEEEIEGAGEDTAPETFASPKEEGAAFGGLVGKGAKAIAKSQIPGASIGTSPDAIEKLIQADLLSPETEEFAKGFGSAVFNVLFGE